MSSYTVSNNMTIMSLEATKVDGHAGFVARVYYGRYGLPRDCAFYERDDKSAVLALTHATRDVIKRPAVFGATFGEPWVRAYLAAQDVWDYGE